MDQKKKEGVDEKSMLTMIVLVLFYPLGIILMWRWMKWNKWIKTLLMVPLVLFVLAIVGFIAVSLLVS